MIIDEREVRHQQVIAIAKQMMVAARTAPKARGIDIIETLTITEEHIAQLSEAMLQVLTANGERRYERDGNNILKAECIVLVGTKSKKMALDCGFCGYPTCAEKKKEVPCTMNSIDVGIAIGSACATAADCRVDTRVMYSAGKIAQELGWLKDCTSVIAIPVSASSKNPFFDRPQKIKRMEDQSTKEKSRVPFFPAEWHKQSGIQLTWPHKETCWSPILDEVETCFISLAKEIAKKKLLIVTPHPEEVKETLLAAKVNIDSVRFSKCNTNDTWARDHGPITLLRENQPYLLDFMFNGWGLKFASNLDNLITECLFEKQVLKGQYINCRNFVLEGGAIESDGEGTLLTTSHCLLAPNRNDTMNRVTLEDYLMDTFYLKRVLWLDYGYLEGDDTDSHIDTLARFCNPSTIAYVQCTDPTDVHYKSLQKMEEQLKSFKQLNGEPYHLVPLPMADAIYDEGQRLPATYANFLIMNEAILYPTYNQKENDKKAKVILQQVFPQHQIIGIDCRPLIKEHGSLHCVTMQFPEGVLV